MAVTDFYIKPGMQGGFTGLAQATITAKIERRHNWRKRKRISSVKELVN